MYVAQILALRHFGIFVFTTIPRTESITYTYK